MTGRSMARNDNVDTMIVFRVGFADAKRLAPALETGELVYDLDRLQWVQPDGIPPSKLMNQPRFQACMKRGTENYFIDTAAPFAQLARYQVNEQRSRGRFAPRASVGASSSPSR